MSSKTQQLIKALGLDFLHNKLFNTGLLQLLCQQQQIHASTTQQQLTHNITIIDKAFQLLKQQLTNKYQSLKHNKKHTTTYYQQQKNLHNMISLFLFNVSAFNQHYIQQIENHLIESTASQSFTNKELMAQTLQKDKMAVNLLKQQLEKQFLLFIGKSVYLKSLVEEICERNEGKQLLLKQGELGLLETVDYLCVKYSVQNAISQKIVQILQRHQPSPQQQQNTSQFYSSQTSKQINILLFNQLKQQQLFNLLQSNPNINYKHILLLINANYSSVNSNKRKIFSNTSRQGSQVVQMLMVKVIKRVAKLQLFTQRNQQYGPFRFILMHLLNKHFEAYWEFTNIISTLMMNSTQSLYKPTATNNTALSTIKKIQQFFRISITLQHPYFQQLLKFTFGILTNKYSQSIAMELIKKLLLNRFLLNPAFFILYHDPTQQEIKKFIQTANFIRTLFYPNKVQQLAEKLNQPELIKLSTQILHSLQYCLKKQKDSKLIINTKNFLYVNDKIIKATITQLYEDLKQEPKLTTPRDNPKIQTLVSDYSLSFSVVKNDLPTKYMFSRPIIENISEVNLASNTNRSNNKDNQSIRYMYDQLKGKKSQSQIPPKSPQKKPSSIHQTSKREYNSSQQNTSNLGRVSQLARKQHQLTNQTRLNTFTLPTDRQMIESLVDLRKQYGQRKKHLKTQYEQRKTKRVKRVTILSSFSIKFNEFKTQIEKDNDNLYVHMTSIA